MTEQWLPEAALVAAGLVVGLAALAGLVASRRGRRDERPGDAAAEAEAIEATLQRRALRQRRALPDDHESDRGGEEG